MSDTEIVEQNTIVLEKSEESSAETNDDDDNDDFSWISENNQEKWCICQQAWDNKRFMIMCDKCMDWYHGDCVGLTKEDGKLLEKNDEKYICPECLKTTKSVKNENKKIVPSVQEKKVIISSIMTFSTIIFFLILGKTSFNRRKR
jgi:hypothetical protein